MAIFYLIRHAQKKSEYGDPPITSIGKKQSQQIVEYLADKNISVIYSSPLKRALQTADIIANKLKLLVIKDNRLRERMNWGDQEGESFEDFLKQWVETDRDRNFVPTHGFSSIASGKRIESLINEIYLSKPDDNIALVSHGGAIGDFVRNVFPRENLVFSWDEEYKVEYIHIKLASITIVERLKDKYSLIKLNFTDHLAKSK